jgi:hypothetical protein
LGHNLNRRWYQASTGQVLTDILRQIRHPVLRWMAATLDGRVEATGAVFESKFMLPWAFSVPHPASRFENDFRRSMAGLGFR